MRHMYGVPPWCNGNNYYYFSIKPELAGFAQVHLLLAARRRFAVVRISDNGLDWK